MVSVRITSDKCLWLMTTVYVWVMELCVWATMNRAKYFNHVLPEIDRQTKKINGMMKHYLWGYINYLQDNWEEWLLVGKFSGNKANSETTGMSLFFTDYSYHSEIQTNIFLIKVLEDAQAWMMVRVLEELQDVLRSGMSCTLKYQPKLTN